MRTAIISALLFVSLVVPASGAWRDKQGNVLPDTPDKRSLGDFGASLILTNDATRLFEIWATPSRDVYPNVSNSVEKGGEISAFIIFSGCEADPGGNCNVLADYRITAPDGSTYADEREFRLWVNRPGPPEGMLELSEGYLKVIIEPDEQLGLYRISALVKDINAGKELMLESEFIALAQDPSKTGEGALTPQEVGEWMMSYYKSPRPELLVPAVKALSTSERSSNYHTQEIFSAFLSFVFRDNPASVKGWMKELSGMPEGITDMLHMALWYSDTREAKAYLKKLGSKNRDFNSKPLVISEMSISSAGSLDLLWAGFFATGDEIYVNRIISVLPYLDTKGETGKLMIGGAARWSLTSNAVMHDRVLDICMRLAKDNTQDYHKHLNEIIAVAQEERSKQGKSCETCGKVQGSE